MGNNKYCNFGCAGDVIDNDSELLIRDLSFNFSWVWYIHLCTNTLGEGMNPPLLPPAMG